MEIKKLSSFVVKMIAYAQFFLTRFKIYHIARRSYLGHPFHAVTEGQATFNTTFRQILIHHADPHVVPDAIEVSIGLLNILIVRDKLPDELTVRQREDLGTLREFGG